MILGRLNAVKRHDDLIEAYADLNQTIRENYQLLIIGDGNEKVKTSEKSARIKFVRLY